MNDFEKKAITNSLRDCNLRYIFKIDKDYYQDEFLFLFEHNNVLLSFHQGLPSMNYSSNDSLELIKNSIEDEILFFENTNASLSSNIFVSKSLKEKIFKKCVEQLKLLRLVFHFDLELLRDYNRIQSFVAAGIKEKKSFSDILNTVLSFYSCDFQSIKLKAKLVK